MIDGTIDKFSVIPVYIQIAELIKSQIKSNQIPAGQKLPSDRKIAKQFSVARGTVLSAFNMLKTDGFIRIEPNCGRYVLFDNGFKTSHNHANPSTSISVIDNAITALLEDNLTISEIRRIFEVRLLKKTMPTYKKIALIDCCKEAVQILHSNFSNYDSVVWTEFLLSKIPKYSNVYDIFSSYDYVLTTTSHKDLVTNLMPELEDRIFAVELIPDNQTIVKIAKLSEDKNIGILAISNYFLYLVQEELLKKDIVIPKENYRVVKTMDIQGLRAFLNSKSVVIIPPFLNMGMSKVFTECLLEYNCSGRTVIPYNYTIDESYLKEFRSIISKK